MAIPMRNVNLQLLVIIFFVRVAGMKLQTAASWLISADKTANKGKRLARLSPELDKSVQRHL